MEQKTDSLHPSAPLESIDLEQKSEKKLNDVKCKIIFQLKTLKILLLTSKIEIINPEKIEK